MLQYITGGGTSPVSQGGSQKVFEWTRWCSGVLQEPEGQRLTLTQTVSVTIVIM